MSMALTSFARVAIAQKARANDHLNTIDWSRNKYTKFGQQLISVTTGQKQREREKKRSLHPSIIMEFQLLKNYILQNLK